MKWMMKQMSFLFINTQELSALMGLAHIQQSAYLLGIRPYMDRKTFLVGIKRRISYQSLAETLYIEPHQGIQSGSPSRQQLRRIINALERAGLVEIQSINKHLILKCLLANADFSDLNKADTKPTQQQDTIQSEIKTDNSLSYEKDTVKANTVKNTKADTPHNSDQSFVCVSKQFQTFWDLYPQQTDQPKAWCAFNKLNPDEALFSKMIEALKQQITSHQELQQLGEWVPNWKYPANWLAQESWNRDSNTAISTKERSNAKGRSTSIKKPQPKSFWSSCGQGAHLSFDDL
jgi:hypothetical protein